MEEIKANQKSRNSNHNISTEELVLNNNNENKNLLKLDYIKIWEKEFGKKTFANDFAGQPIHKSKFNLDEEGGWNIDFYDENDLSQYYITSQKSMYERAGRDKFEIDGKLFEIIKSNKKYKIVMKESENQDFSLISEENLDKNLEKFFPQNVKKYNNKYESYASLLINLNHFPIDYLESVESFLKNIVSDKTVYKNLYVYLNRKSYSEFRTNITSYVRIFFKYENIKEEVDIVFLSLSLKKGFEKFIKNYRSKNNKYVVSFSMVLTNHKSNLKFIQAQTNFDILTNNPVPSKLPLSKLVVDQEYNMTLKFHENEIWKKIKPFALDHKGNTYYVLDVDLDEYV